ncbi:MAG TPA: hypothetical protein VLX44_16380 [Xanthobacteraceae bacterium]|nr:hypothetical protein [Xanthobacteraceae bacterium]
MGRLVRIPRVASSIPPTGSARERASGGTDAEPVIDQDDYLLRLAKYVPAEVLAFSILINAILDQALRNGGKAASMAGMPVTVIAVVALIIGTVMAPFFVWYVHEKGDAWVTNACVSFAAFPFWSYAMGAVAFADYRDGNLAAILLASFTVASGLIKPLQVEELRVREAKMPEAGEAPSEPVARPVPTPPPGPRLVDLSTAINMPGP